MSPGDLIKLSLGRWHFTKYCTYETYSHDFILEICEQDYNVYQLTFAQIDILKLLQNVNYSTNKQTLTGQVSPYKIILDINKIIQYPFDTNFVETTKIIDFITSQNSNAL